MNKTQSIRLAIPTVLILVLACTLPGTSPTVTNTPAEGATEIPVQPADVIFHNGIILTMDESRPQAQAIAIEGENILSVGSNDEILALKDASTLVIDLQGRTIMPGFIDSHSHRMTQWQNWGFSSQQEAVNEFLAQGWTGLDELAVDPNQLQEIIDFDAQAQSHIRLNVYLLYNTFEGGSLGNWFEAYKPGQQLSPYLRIAGLKIFIDFDSGRRLYFAQAELDELIRRLQSDGWTVTVKAISLQSHELALHAYGYALDGTSNEVHRHRIEHSIAASDEQVERMARLGIIVSIQPSLPGVIAFDPDTFRMRDENGPKNTYRWDDYQQGGITLVASPLNPFPHVAELFSPTHVSPMGLLYRSVTQIGVDNQQPEAWMLEKALSVEQLLPMLTINGAYATFEEDVKGSLTPGKYADLVILSENPLRVETNDINNIRVLMTMIGGKVVYCSEGQKSLCPGGPNATPEPSLPTETTLTGTFSGTWQGPDPIDGSVTTLILQQTGDSLSGTFSDTYSPNVQPPGYEGNGSGAVLSDATASITFNLTRWDGKSAQAPFSLTLSNQNNTLTLGCDVGCPIVLQRQ